MVNFGTLAAEIYWQILGTPANFNGFLRLSFVTAATSLNGCQLHRVAIKYHLVPPTGSDALYPGVTLSTTLCTMFSRLLDWYSIYTFSGALAEF